MEPSGISSNAGVFRLVVGSCLASMLVISSLSAAQTVEGDSHAASPGDAATATSVVPNPPAAGYSTAPRSSAVSGTELGAGTTVPPFPGTDEPEVRVLGPAPGSGAMPGGETSDQLVPPDYAGPPPPSATEIPPVVPINSQYGSPMPQGSGALGATSAFASPAENPDITAYTGQQAPLNLRQQLQTFQDYLQEGDNTSKLGVVLRESRRRAADGTEMAGLLVVRVLPGSPAALAGLHGETTATRSALEGAALAASFFLFPPAIIAVAVIDGSGVGESYDLIIGVDSYRVVNFLDFSDQMRSVEPGEIVYLNLLRNGKRMQVPVHIPPLPAPATAASAAAAAAFPN
jgi:hypothetical protein